ncbi:MAG TPA: hypothetical protein PJ988_14180 [Anaerolinea sp.]|nr:hypothetical protein [Anaerolinea sp.]
MPTGSEAFTEYERGWMIRTIRPKSQPPRRVVAFVHGWTGDEHSMEIFSQGLPDDWWILFPRGPITAPSGYGWAPTRQDAWPPISAFEPACRGLMTEIDLRLTESSTQNLPLSLVGFSQGGAVCHALTLIYPDRIDRTAILAGFLPSLDRPYELSRLAGKPYFLAHGLRDETIPVEVAHESVRLLESAGVDVAYCESNTGHKLALPCLKQLHAFLIR